MQKLHLYVRRLAWFIITIGLALLLSSMGVGKSTAQGSDNSIWACKHNRTNVIVIVDATALCPSGWTPITWNIKGEQGPQGVPGSTGPAGDSHWQINGSAAYYNAGNVGIGTTNPDARLTVLRGGDSKENNVVAIGDVVNGVVYDMKIFAGSSYAGLIAKDSKGETRLMFNDGNVGIGTTNPTSKLYVSGKGTFTGGIDVGGKATFSDGVDPPFISFSNESHESIRQYAENVESHEKVMQFWNGEAHRMEVYVVDEDRFYTITGEPIEE